MMIMDAYKWSELVNKTVDLYDTPAFPMNPKNLQRVWQFIKNSQKPGDVNVHVSFPADTTFQDTCAVLQLSVLLFLTLYILCRDCYTCYARRRHSQPAPRAPKETPV